MYDVPADLDTVIAALGELSSDTADASDVELASRMRELVRLRAALDAMLVEQVAAFDTRAGARYDGQTSTVAWLRARLRLGAQASQLVQVARQLDGLPQIGKALAVGEISLEHAAAVAKLAGQVGAEQLVDYEPILLDLARQVPPATLAKACEHVRQLRDPDGGEQDAARMRRQRQLTAARTTGGMVHLQGLLDPAGGDVVLTALAAAMPVPARNDERSATQRRADGLVEVCAGWLATGQAPVSGGIRPQVQVTVSLDTLRTSSSPPSGDPPGDTLGDVPAAGDGTPLTPAQARQTACDAGVIPAVLGGDGQVLDIGRQSRTAPVALRRLLHLRDRGCRFPGCDRPTGWCDTHHLIHWADGGPTNPTNCILLCAWHHTLAHEGWRIHGNPHQVLHFDRPDGTRLNLTSTPRGQPPTRGP